MKKYNYIPLLEKYATDILHEVLESDKTYQLLCALRLKENDKEKLAYLRSEREIVWDKIRQHSQFDWFNLNKENFEDHNILKIILQNHARRSPGCEVLKNDYEYGITKNPKFKYKYPELVEFITDKQLLNFIDLYIKPPQKKDLSLRQIALICQYENIVITESNAKNILIEYEHKISPTSNVALANKYRQFNNDTQRTGEGFKTANDIRLILPFLGEPAKELAMTELKQALINQSKKIED